MGVTIRDVARRADVSVATVSRALRGHSSVLPATRTKVEEAARELDYTLPARGSEPARHARVGVVVPHIGRWYYGRILDGIESVVGERGGELVVVRPFDRQNRRKDLNDAIAHAALDAVIVVSIPVLPREVDALTGRGTAVLLVGTSLPGVSSVAIDDVAAAATLTSHFIDYGHTRIGLVSSASYGSTPEVVAHDRRQGYLAALEATGIAADDDLQVVTDFSLRGAQRAFEQLFAVAEPPTAIVCENDELAFGVLAAARAHGIDVPDILSVGGIDDHEVSAALGLTTIAQPVTSLGEVAAWQALAGTTDAAQVTMPTSLVIRASSRRVAQ